MITRYWEIFFAKVMDLMKSFYLHDLISFCKKNNRFFVIGW